MADSSLPASRSYDDPRSIACLVLFLFAAFVTICPISIPVPVPDLLSSCLYHLRLRRDECPFKRRVYHVHINLNVGPIAAVLLLLASNCIGITEFRAGVAGSGTVHPYDILLLFLSLAYIAISLDATGALRFLAFWVAKKGGSSGRRLHFYLFLFFLILGGIVGNDPVILSGTAFLSYFTQACGIKPPTAWIFSQFMAANLTSMVFVSSNPTNLVISSASQINFIYFSGWTIMPALLSSIALYPILMLQFFRSKNPDFVPRKLEAPNVDPRGELKDVRGAIFKATLLTCTLVALIVSSVFVKGLYVWWVTLPAALLAVIRDVAHDYKHSSRGQAEAEELEKDNPAPTTDDFMHQQPSQIHSTHPSEPPPTRRGPSAGEFITSLEKPGGPPGKQTNPDAGRITLPSVACAFAIRLPTVYSVGKRMPWPLLPFAFSSFILVDSLSTSGWIDLWARWTSIVVRNHDVTAVFFVGTLCILLCNISTNIGATLLLTNILSAPSFVDANSDPRVRQGALIAVAVASNIGAYSFVFPASLAGLLWRGILSQKGVSVHSLEFAKRNLLPLVVTAAVALAVVVAEVRVIFPNV